MAYTKVFWCAPELVHTKGGGVHQKMMVCKNPGAHQNPWCAPRFDRVSMIWKRPSPDEKCLEAKCFQTENVFRLGICGDPRMKTVLVPRPASPDEKGFETSVSRRGSPNVPSLGTFFVLKHVWPDAECLETGPGGRGFIRGARSDGWTQAL